MSGGGEGVRLRALPPSAYDAKYMVQAELPWNALGQGLLHQIVDRLAAKFVEEHGDALLALVDLNVLRAAVVEVVATRLRGDGAVTRAQVREIAEKTRAGVCIECGAHWRSNLKNASGWGFAPEFRESLRERGVDPNTGHKMGCTTPGKENK